MQQKEKTEKTYKMWSTTLGLDYHAKFQEIQKKYADQIGFNVDKRQVLERIIDKTIEQMEIKK